MAFCKNIVHIVQPGDTFYRLAQRYQTTVPKIIMDNPGINPYNLQVGTRLNICAGPDMNTVRADEMDLNNDMRRAWTQHMYWTRMFMVSLFNDLPNIGEVSKRLLQTPEDIGSVYEAFYPQATVNQLIKLLAEHTVLVAEAMVAAKAKDMQKMEEEEQKLVQNADEIASLLSSMNTAYNYDELKKMLLMHIDMLLRQILAEANGLSEEAIRLFDEGENQALELADYLIKGLLDQFYRS